MQWNRRLAVKRMYKTYCWLFCCVRVCDTCVFARFHMLMLLLLLFFLSFLSKFRAIAEQQPLPFNILAKRRRRPQTSSGTGAGAIKENKHNNNNTNNINSNRHNNNNNSSNSSSSNWIAKLALPTDYPRPQWQPLHPPMTMANSSTNNMR